MPFTSVLFIDYTHALAGGRQALLQLHSRDGEGEGGGREGGRRGGEGSGEGDQLHLFSLLIFKDEVLEEGNSQKDFVRNCRGGSYT